MQEGGGRRLQARRGAQDRAGQRTEEAVRLESNDLFLESSILYNRLRTATYSIVTLYKLPETHGQGKGFSIHFVIRFYFC